jgi:hypothetical protein
MGRGAGRMVRESERKWEGIWEVQGENGKGK